MATKVAIRGIRVSAVADRVRDALSRPGDEG